MQMHSDSDNASPCLTYVESSPGAGEKFPHFIADFCIKYASCMRKRGNRLALLGRRAKQKKRKEFALLKSSQHTCRSERQKLRIRHVRRDKSASDIWIFLFKFSALAPFLGCVSLFCVCFSFDILSHMSEATCKIFTKKINKTWEKAERNKKFLFNFSYEKYRLPCSRFELCHHSQLAVGKFPSLSQPLHVHFDDWFDLVSPAIPDS